MPLKLNIGASRKVTDNNYGSRGASVNLEIELDTALVADPPKLQAKIRRLFQLVGTSLAEELNGNGHHANGPTGPVGTGDQPPGDRPAANGTGGCSGPPDTGPRRATAGQCNAIYAIARAHGIDLGDYLLDRYQTRRPDELTLRQASETIDDLKAAAVETAAGS
jgi:hypothetical protein